MSAIFGTQKLDATRAMLGVIHVYWKVTLRNTNTTLLLRVMKQPLDTIEAHSNNCVVGDPSAEATGTGV